MEGGCWCTHTHTQHLDYDHSINPMDTAGCRQFCVRPQNIPPEIQAGAIEPRQTAPPPSSHFAIFRHYSAHDVDKKYIYSMFEMFGLTTAGHHTVRMFIMEMAHILCVCIYGWDRPSPILWGHKQHWGGLRTGYLFHTDTQRLCAECFRAHK